MKMTKSFLSDFCYETGKDMKNKVVTGYDMTDYNNGVIRINLEVIKTDRVGYSGITEYIYTDVVELISFSYQKMLSHNF